MTYRPQRKQLTKPEGENNAHLCSMCVGFYYIFYAYYTAKFYLIYFDMDETVSIVKEDAIMESSDQQLSVGDICHVKQKRKLIEGRVITYG